MSESGVHGLIQHHQGYYFTVLQEDYCEIFKREGKNEVCRAYITSILEHLTNKQFEETGSDEDIWVYMSLPQMSYRMRHACSERTIHKELQGMINDGYLEKRRSVGNATMEYKLNFKKINQELAELPDKPSRKSASSDLANLQEPSCKSARSTLQNCKKDLADLQPRINRDIPKNKQRESSATVSVSSPVAAAPPDGSLSSSSSSTSSAQKEEAPKASLPTMPPKEAPWNEETCQQVFDAKRGRPLPKAKLQRGRDAAATIVERATREETAAIHTSMNLDTYWIERGGADIKNVADNIDRELNKLKHKRNGHTPPPLPTDLRAKNRALKEKCGITAKKETTHGTHLATQH
jgi:hypothetical protein